VTPPRPPASDADLLERLDQTFVQLHRQHEQLELALEPWQGEKGRRAFHAAYESDDPAARNRAELVHANFERHHQLTRDIIEVAGKLAERRERLPKPATGEDRIHVLLQEGLITRADEALLRQHTIVRNESQHAYVQTAASQVYEAAERQINDGRTLVGRLAAFVETLRAAA